MKLAMETDSPKLHSILTLEPPPLLKVYGVIDCPFDLEKLKKNIKNKNPLLIKKLLFIHLGKLKVAELGSLKVS